MTKGHPDILSQLSHRGVRFALGGSVYDWNDPFARMFLQILAVIAEFEASLIRQLRALARSPFTRQRLTTFVSRHRLADLETLARLIDAGRLTPVIGKTYPLHQAPDAMRDLLAGLLIARAVQGAPGA
jgi:NADPH:quinone reductase-like Zn-dependent oxidoreductase